ncbi:MAG: NUDIX hydrolase [Cyclobacteriaceae bacterium]|nr:NUDIX hydrolase [Cyclobacteriaceae bacterium HetDA_MAG_MS6]
MSQFPDQVIDALSIDTVIFGFDGTLKVLLVKHAEGISEGRWALPGGWIKYNEGLDDAAYRILSSLTGVKDIYLKQLQAFGSLDRFPDKRVVTVAYYSLIQPEEYDLIPGFTASDAKWFDLQDAVDLPYDHDQILAHSIQHLRHIVQHEPIGFNLLPERFTLFQLQRLYEAILGITLDKPNFRRKIMKMNLLADCHEKEAGVPYRAAKLYRFDKQIYDQLLEKGFNFEF